jgi:hypothetical protein
VINVTPRIDAQSVSSLRIERIATYGWSDLSDSTRPLSATERKLGAGMLGSANGAVEGQDGLVYVLDLPNRKVAVFEKGGELRTVFGGEGEGPGEFRQPTDIVTGTDGAMYVWDGMLSRLTRFTGSGKNLSQVTIPGAPRPARVAVVGDRIWFSRLVMKSGYAVKAFDLRTGRIVDSLAPLTEEEVGLSSYGAQGSIAGTETGDVVFAGPFPVTLRIWSRGTSRTTGFNRFPGAKGTLSENGGRSIPLNMRGLAPLHGGNFAAIYWATEGVGASKSQVQRIWLEILDRNGQSLGKTEFPKVDRISGLSATPSGDLLVSLENEYPQVWRIRVTVGAKAKR